MLVENWKCLALHDLGNILVNGVFRGRRSPPSYSKPSLLCSLAAGPAQWKVPGAAQPCPAQQSLQGHRWGCQAFLALPSPRVRPCWAAGIPEILTQPSAGSMGRELLDCRSFPSVPGQPPGLLGKGRECLQTHIYCLGKAGLAVLAVMYRSWVFIILSCESS